MSSCKKEDVPTPVSPQEIIKNLNGTIEILNGNFTDYQVFSEIDDSEISANNEFNIATHSVIYAVNRNNDKPVYFGIPQKNDNYYLLNAKETALYFALQAIPNINNFRYNISINNFKLAVYELQEVKDLESEIQESVQENGFLDYDEVGTAIGLAVDKIIDELGLLESSFGSRSPNWDDTYAAGRGFYRIDKRLPDGWEDEYDEGTQTYKLKRKFFNNTPAVVGVKVEKFNFEENTVNTPLDGDYIGFIEPWYPPNLISVDGTWENLKSWGQATADLFSNGWDGLVNTDAYSSDSEFEFEAKQGVKDAIVFTNGYYDAKVIGVNWIYLFASNFEDIFKDQYPDLYTNEDFLFGFIEWMVQNNAISLGNYVVWGNQRQEDLIINDLKEKLLNYIELDGVLNPGQNYVLSEIIGKLNDAIDRKFELIAGSLGKVYKYSRKAFQVVGFLLTTSSPKFAAAIPLEFEDVLTQPPFPYQPSPFSVTLDNVTSYNFQWALNNTNNQNVVYNLYLGEKVNELELIASSISTTSYSVSDLLLNTRYYWQIEVINSSGQKSTGAIWTFDNGLVNEVGWLFDERDGQTYNWVEIEGKKWMSQNLNYDNESSVCYNNDNLNCESYGRLYDPINSTGICPNGWHKPSSSELETLTTYYDYNDLTLEGSSGFDYNLSGWYGSLANSYRDIGQVGYLLSNDLNSDQSLVFAHQFLGLNNIIQAGEFSTQIFMSCRCVEGEEESEGEGEGNNGSVNLEFVLVEGRVFEMGCTSEQPQCVSASLPVHTVTLDAYKIGKYEVTNHQFVEFLNDIDAMSDGTVGGVVFMNMISEYNKIDHNGNSFYVESGWEDHPVVEASWYGAQAFCVWVGGRLPTEAEWEYAARGGNLSQGYLFSGSDEINDVAWYNANTNGTQEVGTKNSNELGLFDMTGNAEEWCNDWWDINYFDNSPDYNPQGPDSGTNRVVRGSNYSGNWNGCLMPNRYGRLPESTTLYRTGFRCAKDL
jgi:uncharacterized protein (TIGR02145 family)